MLLNVPEGLGQEGEGYAKEALPSTVMSESSSRLQLKWSKGAPRGVTAFWVARTLTWLLLGAVCTLLSAWALYRWPSGFGEIQEYSVHEPYGDFYICAVHARGVLFAYINGLESPQPWRADFHPPAWRWTRLGERTRTMDWDARGIVSQAQLDALSAHVGLMNREVGAGWPMLAFRWHADLGGASHGGIPLSSGVTILRHVENGHVQELDRWSPLRLPILPIWPGLIVNSILYGLLCGLSWNAARRSFLCVVKRVRVRRGMCGACGYVLEGLSSSVCPECGAEVGERKGSRATDGSPA